MLGNGGGDGGQELTQGWNKAGNGEESEAAEDNFLLQNVKPCSASTEDKVVVAAVNGTP